MTSEIIIPSVGESITQVTIGAILKPTGTYVHRDDELLEIETDKLNQVIYAPSDGIVNLTVSSGKVCSIGEVIGSIVEGEAPKMDVPPKKEGATNERTTAIPLSSIRRAICQRLKQAQSNTVMLTTFNEVDMSKVIAIRTEFQERFQAAHQVKLGFMSFFVKSVCLAMTNHPMVNSYIDGDTFVTRHYFDIGVAVASERGLVVPILRDADTLSFAQIEKSLMEFRQKADSGNLQAGDMKGGCFTITNGGVFGSLLSTPILNPPQSAILGMHKIIERAVVVDGQIVIRPMMNVALTYDHCVLDGKDAVLFLNSIKKQMEEPELFISNLI